MKKISLEELQEMARDRDIVNTCHRVKAKLAGKIVLSATANDDRADLENARLVVRGLSRRPFPSQTELEATAYVLRNLGERDQNAVLDEHPRLTHEQRLSLKLQAGSLRTPVQASRTRLDAASVPQAEPIREFATEQERLHSFERKIREDWKIPDTPMLSYHAQQAGFELGKKYHPANASAQLREVLGVDAIESRMAVMHELELLGMLDSKAPRHFKLQASTPQTAMPDQYNLIGDVVPERFSHYKDARIGQRVGVGVQRPLPRS